MRFKPAMVRWTLLLTETLFACKADARKQPDRAPDVSQISAAAQNQVVGLPGAPPFDPALSRALLEVSKNRRALGAPRTRHLNPDGSPKYTNRLFLETSPYLLQHAHNPVNWHPWGDEAFARAKSEKKPVLLSIGYSTCHWCHVMERESFEDVEIARVLNEHFVAIKVDREERPDVDSLYMNAVQMLTGRGGWPMTVVLTYAREPFFAGTYFPARDGDRGAQKGFLSILRELSDVYKGDPHRVVTFSRQITERLRAAAQTPSATGAPGPDLIRAGAVQLAKRFDSVHGGFGNAPKFPTPSNIELIARYHRRTGDRVAHQMVERTLAGMAAGGIRDHVGGGFHRYSTDARWLVPHFEKMLYDNAQLVIVYLEGYQITRRDAFAQIARETLDYLAREMSDSAGGFYSATDADSRVGEKDHEEEGWFFTWTAAELRRLLGRVRAGHVEATFGVTAQGNFEGRNVLYQPAALEVVARTVGVSAQALGAEIRAAKRILYEARERRPRPIRDDKIIASWNGLAISAFARGAAVFANPAYAERAARAARFVLDTMRDGDKLRRTFRLGRARHEGLLDDYAFVVQGLLDLFEATHDIRWLNEAKRLHAVLERDFWDDKHGGFFQTPHRHEALLVREKPDSDGAEPSGNSVAILNLLRLGELTQETRARQFAEKALRVFSGQMKGGWSAGKILSALDFFLDKPLQVIIVGPTTGAAKELEATFHRAFVPNRIFVVATEGNDLDAQAKIVPLARDKHARRGKATAYVCRDQICELPTSDPKVFAAQLAKAEPLFEFQTPAPLPAARR